MTCTKAAVFRHQAALRSTLEVKNKSSLVSLILVILSFPQLTLPWTKNDIEDIAQKFHFKMFTK